MNSKASSSFLETVSSLGYSSNSAHFSSEGVVTSMSFQRKLIGYIALRHSSIKLQIVAVSQTEGQKA